MIWRNIETGEFHRKGGLKTKDGTIFNPSEETLRKYGFEVFIQPAPQPTPPPMPSELRRMAYEAECDPLLPSIQSYELQGKTEQLEAVKAEWYARHKAIEERHPNEVEV